MQREGSLEEALAGVYFVALVHCMLKGWSLETYMTNQNITSILLSIDAS